MDLYLISRLPPEYVDDFVEEVETQAVKAVGSHYTVSVRAVYETSPFATIVTTARNHHNPLPEMFFDEGGVTHIVSGYVVDDIWREGVRRYFGKATGDDRPILRSPGGVYSYVSVRRSDGQVCAGQSLPTLEPVYFANSYASFHVGNHPLLVHLADRRFKRPMLSNPFFLSALPAAAAIDDTTPFVGCYRVPPRKILVNKPGTCAIDLKSAAEPSFGRFRTSNYEQRLSAMEEALLDAASILKRLPKSELRVSGGKDSRLVAAAMISEGIDTVPVNQNLPEEVEGQIADLVSRQMGLGDCVRVPFEDAIRVDDLLGETARKIAYSGGLPSTAPLQYPNRHEGIEVGTPVVMGHAHLQRGGMAFRIRRAQDAAGVAASRTSSPLLRPDFLEANLRRTRSFVDSQLALPGALVQRVGFTSNLEFTVNYLLQALYAYMRNWHHLVSPMVDERFVAVCNQISLSPAEDKAGELPGIIDLKQERLVVGLIGRLAPSLLQFPLADARFLADTPEMPGHDLRDPNSVARLPLGQRRPFNTRMTNVATRRLLWSKIEGGVADRFGGAAVLPEFWAYVSDPGTEAPEGASLVALNQLLWSVFGLAMILGSEWWESIDR